MINGKRFIKSGLAVSLALILCFNGYAAIVSDNDGSAFVTKAEFDALKSNFKSQIEQYNESIDNKIDGAIAAYLAGIRLVNSESYEVPIANYKSMKWINDLLMWNTQRTWDAGATTNYSQSGWAWRRAAWSNVRNIRQEGTDLASTWLAAGTKRQTTWMMNIKPNIESNTKFGKSDFINNRLGNRAVPVLVLDLPLIDGYNVLKDGQNKLFIESISEVYGNINPRWEEGYEYQSGSGATTRIWNQMQYFVTTPKTKVILSSDSDYWMKLEARVGHYNNVYKLKSDGVNYEPREWNEITDAYKWTIWQNFDSKAGTFAQPANWFVKAPRSERNTGFISVLEYLDLGGDITGINDNKGNNYRAELSVAYRNSYQMYETILNDFMLGQNSSQICNVGNQKDVDEVSGSTWRYDWSDSEWADMSVDYTFYVNPQAHVIDAYKLSGLTADDFKYVSETPCTIKWPLWPRLSVMDLRHSQYVLNNVPLKVGQGLPLIVSASNNGILKMKFKYKVNVQNGSNPSQKAKIYVKKNDFTTNVSSDYYENQATTTTTEGSLNGYVMETNNTLEFSIHVIKEDSVWMRLSPFDTDPSGLYAVIDDIQLQLEAE